jgi:hypothetical protein
MAQFKYLYFLALTSDRRFDHISAASVAAPHTGIFRCHACGREVAANKGDLLPAGNDHAHTDSMGPIRWRLAVATQG